MAEVDLNALFKKYGVDPSQLQGGGQKSTTFPGQFQDMPLYGGTDLGSWEIQLDDGQGNTWVIGTVAGGHVGLLDKSDDARDLDHKTMVDIQHAIGQTAKDGSVHLGFLSDVLNSRGWTIEVHNPNVKSDGPYNYDIHEMADGSGKILIDKNSNLDEGPGKAKTATISEQLQSVFEMDEEEVKSIKMKLWLAGYYGKSMKLEDLGDLGQLNSDDVNALESVMVSAGRYWAGGKAITWQDLLDSYAEGHGKAQIDGLESGKAPRIFTSKEDLESTLRDTASKLLGRNPTSEEARAFAAGYYGAQQQAFDVRDSNGEGMSEPTVGNAAEEFLRKTKPEEVKAVTAGDRMAEFYSLLNSSSAPGVVDL